MGSWISDCAQKLEIEIRSGEGVGGVGCGFGNKHNGALYGWSVGLCCVLWDIDGEAGWA